MVVLRVRTERRNRTAWVRSRAHAEARGGRFSVHIDSPPCHPVARRPSRPAARRDRVGQTRRDPATDLRPTSTRLQGARAGKADGSGPIGRPARARADRTAWRGPHGRRERPPSLPWDHGAHRILCAESYPQSTGFVNRSPSPPELSMTHNHSRSRSKPPPERVNSWTAHAGLQGDGCPSFVVSYWNLSCDSQRYSIPGGPSQVDPAAT